MKCTFIHKSGRTFNSELALDEYLANAIKYEGESDIVFSFKHNTTQRSMEHTIKGRAAAAEKVMKDVPLIPIDTDLFEDYDVSVFPPGHMPVTHGLATYVSADGDILFPHFNEDNYWENKVKKYWDDLQYWQGTRSDGKKADQNEINAVFGEGTKASDIKEVPKKEAIEIGKRRISLSWPLQGFIGSGIHRVFKKYWESVNKGITDPNEIIQVAKKDLEGFTLINDKDATGKYAKYKGIYMSDIIPDKAIKSAVEECAKLHNALTSRFGNNLLFIPEISAITQVNDFNGDDSITNLVGNFDLLVIDESGNVQIIDYKTSPKTYSNYDSAKKRTFFYQLATYRRMVERMGFKLNGDSGVYVVPVQMLNYVLHSIDLDKDPLTSLVTFSDIKIEDQMLEKLDIFGVGSENISTNVDKLIPPLETGVVADGDILDEVENFTQNKFSAFIERNKVSLENTKQMLEDRKADKKKDNKYRFVFNGKTIVKDTFEELIDAVFKERQNIEAGELYLRTRTQDIKSKIKEATEHPELVTAFKGSRHLAELLGKYTDGNYEILDNYNEALESMGVILIQHKISKRIDVLVCDISAHDLTEKIHLGKGTTILGSFVSDIQAKTRPNELALDAVYGNIKLMQVMAALNKMPNLLENANIGELVIFNLAHNQGLGLTASNELLLYNFAELCRLDKEHKVANTLNNVKFNTYLANVRAHLAEVTSTNIAFKSFVSSVNDFDKLPTDDVPAMRSKLVEIAEQIEETFGLKYDTKIETNINNPRTKEAYTLLMDIHNAIAEMDGVHFKQQINDHAKYMNLIQLRQALTKGWSANSLDNPGMLDSDLLNLVGRQLNIGYQNVRDEMSLVDKKLRELGEKLRRDKGFTYVKSRTVGNEASLFTNMYLDREDDLLFKNPFKDPSLLESEREYLKFALLQINMRRYANIHTMEDLEKMINSDEKYLRVPLKRGSFSSKVANKGLKYALIDSFKKLWPTKENILEVFNKFITDEESVLASGDELAIRRMEKSKNKDLELWHMSSDFDHYETEKGRQDALTKHGIDFFERNLEALTYAHSFSYAMKDSINKIFPTIKAIAYQLEYQGFVLNNRFANDLSYLHDYVTAKILNMSIQDPRWLGLTLAASKIMSGASKLALAFNPILLYLAIDGLWKDIRLCIQNPDGTDAFTAAHFKDAFFWVYKELVNFGNDKSLARRLNEIYGINDMDMNVYDLKIRPNQFGMFNFNNLAFHFAARPDFYNRMTIFNAHMRADGCFEAHDENGNYDWTKDKRYNIFALYAGKEDTIPSNLKAEYNKQKAHYQAAAILFRNEGARYMNSKGELQLFDKVDLEKPLPLPRAYTVKEAESIKSICDLTYGYYSHEKKSLVLSITAGALFMQMNTYWSSKKNQFMAPGGIRMTGKWVQYEENGEPYYEDENGEPTTEVTGVPYLVWQGLYQEGIFVTLAGIVKETYKTKSLIGAYKSYVNNEDKNLRTAYRSNLSLLWYDLLMMLLLGVFVAPALQKAAKGHVKEVGNENFADACVNNALMNSVQMLKTSTDDFFFINTIFLNRGMQWTPFALKTLSNTVSRISSCISGNTDMYDTLVKINATGRAFEETLDCVKMDWLGRPIGDNGQED